MNIYNYIVKQVRKLTFDKILIFVACVVTLVITPWFNKDAMVIPKIIILFICALITLPKLLVNIEQLRINKFQLVFLIISLFLFAQMLISILLSSAPIEQQIYGRTGRGLGFITIFSLTIIETLGPVVVLLATYELSNVYFSSSIIFYCYAIT